MLEKFSQGFSSQKTPACVKWQTTTWERIPSHLHFQFFSVSLSWPPLTLQELIFLSPVFPRTGFLEQSFSVCLLIETNTAMLSCSQAPVSSACSPSLGPASRPVLWGPAVLCSESPHSSWHHPGPQTTDATPHACDEPNLRAFRVYFLLS